MCDVCRDRYEIFTGLPANRDLPECPALKRKRGRKAGQPSVTDAHPKPLKYKRSRRRGDVKHPHGD